MLLKIVFLALSPNLFISLTRTNTFSKNIVMRSYRKTEVSRKNNRLYGKKEMKIKINHQRTITKWTFSGARVLYDIPSVTTFCDTTYRNTEVINTNYKVMQNVSGFSTIDYSFQDVKNFLLLKIVLLHFQILREKLVLEVIWSSLKAIAVRNTDLYISNQRKYPKLAKQISCFVN